jgi:hypothetical protein
MGKRMPPRVFKLPGDEAGGQMNLTEKKLISINLRYLNLKQSIRFHNSNQPLPENRGIIANNSLYFLWHLIRLSGTRSGLFLIILKWDLKTIHFTGSIINNYPFTIFCSLLNKKRPE